MLANAPGKIWLAFLLASLLTAPAAHGADPASPATEAGKPAGSPLDTGDAAKPIDATTIDVKPVDSKDATKSGKADAAKTDAKAPASGDTKAGAKAHVKAETKADTKTDAKATKPAATKDTAAKGAKPVVELKTTEGIIRLELDEKAAPISTKNFVAYVNDKFYDGTLFHRVIDGFMIQGGGFTGSGDKLAEKKTKDPIANEAKNGLKNDRGTIAMARTGDPNSATAQFFINHVDNDNLNYPQPDGHGYAVFGKVIEGIEVVDKIAKVKTGMRSGMGDVPVADVKILSAALVQPAG